MPRIGVFDSGVGGLSVVNAIKNALPDAQVEYIDDKANVPYGSKSPKQLYELVLPVLDKLSETNDVIVVACNTVSTTLINQLRQKIKVPLVAMEPMVKLAVNISKSKIIAICATPTTLASERFAWLKNEYAAGLKIIEPDCSKWAYMIEGNRIDHKIIDKQIDEVCQAGADVIVLGCTHYHWIEQDIKKVAVSYNATVLQPEQPVIEQLQRVLEQISE